MSARNIQQRDYQRRVRLSPEYQPRLVARTAVRHALRNGLLQKAPCEVCGSERSEAHHDDYSLPLAVRWLCKRHHAAHHAAEFEKSIATIPADGFRRCKRGHALTPENTLTYEGTSRCRTCRNARARKYRRPA